MNNQSAVITRDRFDAVLFDLDGVLTATAAIHAACWKEMFDAFLLQRSKSLGETFIPFDISTDYKMYVDGKPRSDGVRSFLQSRKIDLPEGSRIDPVEQQTVVGLSKRKDALVRQAIAAGQAEVFPDAVEMVHRLLQQGIRTAVVSSSRNCKEVLHSVGIADLFEVVVDGKVAEQGKLAGKPAPDTCLKAAELLQVSPDRAVVVEDAVAGVQAGKAGGFALVVGVKRDPSGESLQEYGADIVLTNLRNLVV